MPQKATRKATSDSPVVFTDENGDPISIETDVLQGRYTRYRKENGLLILDPVYDEEFDQLIADQFALDTLIGAAMAEGLKRQAEIKKRTTELWRRLYEDIGIDLTSTNWTYDHIARGLRQVVEEPVETS